MAKISDDIRAQWYSPTASIDPVLNDKFYVEILDDHSVGKAAYRQYIYDDLNFYIDDIRPQNFESFSQKGGISLETTSILVGGFAFPMAIGASSKEGFQFEITLREDRRFTISKFIHHLQRRIINDKGFHWPPQNVPFSEMKVYVPSNSGKYNAVKYTFHEVYPTEIPVPVSDFSYSSGDPIKYNFGFVAKYYEVEYHNGH